MSKHPGTSGLMPVKGSSCGIRPDTDAMADDTGFDFSAAIGLLQQQPENQQPEHQAAAESTNQQGTNPSGEDTAEKSRR